MTIFKQFIFYNCAQFMSTHFIIWERDMEKTKILPFLISGVKVHLFLKQCLRDLQLTQFGGTFYKPFKLTSADISS